MNIAKLILLACPLLLTSVLLIANPAQASGMKSASATQFMNVASVLPIPDLVTPQVAPQSNPIIDQVGCNCANCVQSKFQMLQGKLPSVGF
ncbi:MAG: hypothetical protein KME32_00935 [Mojavia pulchra JT2-VF2]|jgi:hypothetical protein|uniref:Uncharacterized protein n=1 Tax=Mojavia pulchra JT2-VF2 TaxID=287848 RepID=A0A951UFC5_9NOST|nr:hypothetical protein [Mojavia pulchra JT2-VF2]